MRITATALTPSRSPSPICSPRMDQPPTLDSLYLGMNSTITASDTTATGTTGAKSTSGNKRDTSSAVDANTDDALVWNLWEPLRIPSLPQPTLDKEVARVTRVATAKLRHLNSDMPDMAAPSFEPPLLVNGNNPLEYLAASSLACHYGSVNSDPLPAFNLASNLAAWPLPLGNATVPLLPKLPLAPPNKRPRTASKVKKAKSVTARTNPVKKQLDYTPEQIQRRTCFKCGKVFRRVDALNNHLRLAEFRYGGMCRSKNGRISKQEMKIISAVFVATQGMTKDLPSVPIAVSMPN